MEHTSTTNVSRNEFVESDDYFALVTLNLYEDSSLARIEFFASEHNNFIYKAPPVFQHRYKITGDVEGVAFVVDISRVDDFAQEIKPICEAINLNSEFVFDERNGYYIRQMNDVANDLADELTHTFAGFIDSGDWQDSSVTIVDTSDFWTHEALLEIYRPNMSFEDFEQAVISAQTVAESDTFKIHGVAYGMIGDAFDAAMAQTGNGSD